MDVHEKRKTMMVAPHGGGVDQVMSSGAGSPIVPIVKKLGVGVLMMLSSRMSRMMFTKTIPPMVAL
eukprot:680114-Prorocentrum_minimum.AAC.1